MSRGAAVCAAALVLTVWSGIATGWIPPPRPQGYSVAQYSCSSVNQVRCSRGVSLARQNETAASIQVAPAPDSLSSPSEIWTSAIVNITYDGGRFTGWSSANDESEETHMPQQPFAKRRRRKRRGVIPRGFVRSVEGVFLHSLAKLYGNVDPDRVQVEGCSRTDKGVHAHSMTAQLYCLSQAAFDSINKAKTLANGDSTTQPASSIPGKRLPHPKSSTDSTYFEPLPFDLTKIQYCLNRMLPDDVRVRNIAPAPTKNDGLPFHPTLDSVSKTYRYTFSVGPMHDPVKRRFVWHLDGVNQFNLDTAQQAAQMFVGTHDFCAFRGAPRGNDDKRRQQVENTTCTITNLDICIVDSGIAPQLETHSVKTYTVTVTGNRFLYKMVRFLVGSLVAVGTGRIASQDIKRSLETGSWESQDEHDWKQFVCAPPHGLVLQDVSYEDNIQMDWII